MAGASTAEVLGVEFDRMLAEWRDEEDSPVQLQQRLDDFVRDGLDINNIDLGLGEEGTFTALHRAAHYGSLVAVKVLLTPRFCKRPRDTILQGTSIERDTVLHSAVVGGNIEILETLMQLAATDASQTGLLEISNRFKETPFHYAVGLGELQMAGLLINQLGTGVINARDISGATPLHFAARCGEIEALDLLEKEGGPAFDVHQVNYVGMSAAHYAAKNCKVYAIRWLADRGLNVNAPDTFFGFTPLHWAAHWGGTRELLDIMEIAKCYLLHKKDRNGRSVLQLVEEQGKAHVQDLLRALLSKERIYYTKEMLKCIVEYGDEEQNAQMMTYMQLTAAHAPDVVAAQFIKKKSNAAEYGSGAGEGETPMEWAAIKGNTEALEAVIGVVRCLTSQIGDQELEDQLKSALRLALDHGNMDFAAEVGEHYAIDQDKFVIWIQTIEKGITKKDTMMKDRLRKLQKYLPPGKDAEQLIEEEVPFAYWLFNGSRGKLGAVGRLITERTAWEDIVNRAGKETGWTPLHCAAIAGSRDAVAELCKIEECRKCTKDKLLGKTAYEYAVKLQHKDIQLELALRSSEVRSYLELLYKDREVFVDAMNAILVGAALISSITFAGFLQPPLGYSADTGHLSPPYIAIRHPGVKVFWVCNSLSFFFGMGSALAGASGVLPMPDMYIGDVVKHIRRVLLVAASLLVVSIAFVLLAFGAAGFSVLPPFLKEQANMIATASLGSSLCTCMLLWFLKALCRLIHPFPALKALCRQLHPFPAELQPPPPLAPSAPPQLIPVPPLKEVSRQAAFAPPPTLGMFTSRPWRDGLAIPGPAPAPSAHADHLSRATNIQRDSDRY